MVIAICAFNPLFAAAAESAAAVPHAVPPAQNSCGGIREVTDLGGLMDYRYRYFDDRVKFGVAQIDRYHTEPARSRAAVNPTDRSIIADLDFTLRHSPNHLDALRQLLTYTKAGGRAGDFFPIECYFDWASRFAPDDSAVLQLGALYYWKSGRTDMAEALFRNALALAPKSIDLHYQVGLFYADIKRYDAAREHARIAYDGGYPLTGLRNVLERAGQWNAASGSTQSPKP